jgi:hypothetical protein
VSSDEVRAARAAKAVCLALVLLAVSVFGVAEVPAALPMLAPVIGLSLALPIAIAPWMTALSPRHARLLAELAVVALVAIGSASLSRATAVQVCLVYFVPAFLLLHAADHIPDPSFGRRRQ